MESLQVGAIDNCTHLFHYECVSASVVARHSPFDPQGTVAWRSAEGGITALNVKGIFFLSQRNQGVPLGVGF